MQKEKFQRKSSIFIKILLIFIIISLLPGIVSSFLIISTYEEIIHKYVPSSDIETIEKTTGEILSPLEKESLKKIDEELTLSRQNAKIQAILTLFLVAILSIFTSVLISRNLNRSLKKLVKGTEAISRGNLDFKIKIKPTDEIGELADYFNQMTQNLRETRNNLLTEKNRTGATITSLIDGLIMFDRESKIALVNPEAEVMFGIRAKNLIGKTLKELTHLSNLNKLSQLIERPVKRALFKKELFLKEPIERVLEITTTPVIDAEGANIGFIVVLHDITREKAIDKMKSEFISITAHQLRTPLSAIKWCFQMVIEGDLGEISKEQKEILQKGYLSNERMIKIVNDLLNVSRIEEGKFLYNLSLVSLEDIIKNSIKDLEHTIKEKHIGFTLLKPLTPLPNITVDSQKISLAFQNLLANAIQYTPKEGRVIVIVSMEKNKEKIEVIVKDTGVGIPIEQQKKIFTKFFRGDNAIRMQPEGSGMGLFLTKNIIERHGGKIWFESEEGKGSTFHFTLPIK